MKKRMLHTLFAAILSGVALILPTQPAFASAGSIGLDPAVGITLFHEKKLDLSAIDAGIYFTESDRADIREQIRRDFLTDFAYVVSDIIEKQEELEASGVPLRLEDGSYNPDWDEQWDRIYPNDRASLYTSLRGKYGEEKKALLSGDGVTDEIRLYARESFLYIGQNPLIDPYVQKAQKILDENGIYFTAADTTPYPLTGNDQNKPGTIAWHEAFDNVLGGTIDNYYIRTLYSYYEEYLFDRRMNSLLRERIADKLDVSFDFYVEEISPDEEETYGISPSGQGTPVIAGKFADEHAGETVFISSVDFGGENQKSDLDLSASFLNMPDVFLYGPFATGTFLMRERRFGSLDPSIFFDSDPYDTQEYYETIRNMADTPGVMDEYRRLIMQVIRPFETSVHKDQFSVQSVSEPYVHQAFYRTHNTPGTMWPYDSATRGEQDLNWNAQWLGDYNVLNGWGISRFVEEIPLIGANDIGITGVNFYRPEFDENGKLISVSKPLFNALKNAVNASSADEDEGYGFDLYNPQAWESISKGLSDEERSGRFILRYKLIEDPSKEHTISDGREVKTDRRVLLIDFIPNEGFIVPYVFSSPEEAKEFYSAMQSSDMPENERMNVLKNYAASRERFTNVIVSPPTEPEDPAVPEEPTTPEQPVAPKEPAIPEKPTTPEEPAIPEEPTIPDVPAVPNEPVVPEAPAVPEKPEGFDDPSVPDQPIEPEGSGMNKNKAAVKTGDRTYQPYLYVLILILTTSVGICLLYRHRLFGRASIDSENKSSRRGID